MSKARLFVDSDERTALELWTELERIYTASNVQAIQNLKNLLDSLLYVDGKDWNAHVTKFLTITGELATFNAELSPTDQTSKLLRSLPPSFSPLAMVSDLTEIKFDKLVSAVQSEIARRSNPNNPQQGNGQLKAHSTTLTGKRKASVRNRTSRIKKNGWSSNITCYYCHKRGHRISDCYKRQNDEAAGNYNRGGRGRGRGQGRDRGFDNRSSRGGYGYNAPHDGGRGGHSSYGGYQHE